MSHWHWVKHPRVYKSELESWLSHCDLSNITRMTSTENYSETKNDAADSTESNKGGIDSGVVSPSFVNRTLIIYRLSYVALIRRSV